MCAVFFSGPIRALFLDFGPSCYPNFFSLYLIAGAVCYNAIYIYIQSSSAGHWQKLAPQALTDRNGQCQKTQIASAPASFHFWTHFGT
jgi:hypothetical protein